LCCFYPVVQQLKQVMKLPFAGSFREPKAQIRHNTPKVIDLMPQSKVLSNL